MPHGNCDPGSNTAGQPEYQQSRQKAGEFSECHSEGVERLRKAYRQSKCSHTVSHRSLHGKLGNFQPYVDRTRIKGVKRDENIW